MGRTDLRGTGMGLYTTWNCSKIENLMCQFSGGSFPKKGKCHCMSPCSQPVLSPTSSWAFSPEPVLRGEHISSANTHRWWVTSSQKKLLNPTNNQEDRCALQWQFLADWISATSKRCDPSLALVITVRFWKQLRGIKLKASATKSGCSDFLITGRFLPTLCISHGYQIVTASFPLLLEVIINNAELLNLDVFLIGFVFPRSN